MINIKASTLVFVFAMMAIFMATSTAHAVQTLNVIVGQFHGATGIEINHTLYDVQFVDGTCQDQFAGCDAVKDFAINTRDEALAAAEALLEFVFVDIFDETTWVSTRSQRGHLAALPSGVATPLSLTPPSQTLPRDPPL